MLERLRQCRVSLLLIAVLVTVIRMGGLHAHVDVPASLEQGFGTQEHFNTSILDVDHHDHDHQDDSGHVDVETVGASDRQSGWAGFDFDGAIIIGLIALALAAFVPLRPRPILRTPQRWSKPIHLRPLLRGPPLDSVT